MSDELQTLCFLAEENSIFIGDVLLTTMTRSAALTRICWPGSAPSPILLKSGSASALVQTSGLGEQ
ncbi:hypothetical protein ACNJYA_08605 [Bradyrhizobium sp. DASA03068]|uniref:hypothetical protein n=1 Tax=Bradyrhizobium sp. BLXBL-01 TaxID=3395915 RepID=UPI003F72CD9E